MRAIVSQRSNDFDLGTQVANCEGFLVPRPCNRPERTLECRLRRARSATRSKPHREAVRGSGRSAGEVDESATGSANSWSGSPGRTHARVVVVRGRADLELVD